ncbi:MAG: CDGSH iron-sulfur domain-containing protein [Leptospirales bacterium]
MEKVQVKCIKNGPYEVQGTLTIVDANGKTVSSMENKTYHLCRCGGSKIKPMCDGTHERIHFQSE